MFCQKWFYPFKGYNFAIFFPIKGCTYQFHALVRKRLHLAISFYIKMSYAIMIATTLKNSKSIDLKSNNTSAKVHLHFQCTGLQTLPIFRFLYANCFDLTDFFPQFVFPKKWPPKCFDHVTMGLDALCFPIYSSLVGCC